MSLKFYYSPMSSATRIHWALEELGVPYEKVKLDLTAGDQRKPEYLALNPNGKVPLVVDDGTVIYESLAILLHLGERYGVEKDLFPSASAPRAEAFKWMAWAQGTLVDTASRIMRNSSERFPAEQHNVKQLEAARKEIAELLGILDKELDGKEYLVGGKFSFADLAIAAYVPFMARLGVDLGPHKHVQAWVGRCMGRPAMARVMTGQA
jgi:glutathione S-transferase